MPLEPAEIINLLTEVHIPNLSETEVEVLSAALAGWKPAEIGAKVFQSEGCDVFGDTAYWSGGGLQAFTVAFAFDSTPCNWVYVRGQYYAYPTWYLDVGPYWAYEPSDGEYTYLAPNATVGDFDHSACNAGGACSNAVYVGSNYP